MAQQCLLDLMSIIPDPRAQDDRLKHKLIDILVITFTAVLSGCETWGEIEDYGHTHESWLKEFLDLPNGIPSHDTFARVFSILDFEAFAAVFWQWVDLFNLAHKTGTTSEREIVSIDAKFLRGSLRESHHPRSALLIVSAYSNQSGICLGFERSELKPGQGEKHSTEKLIESLYLKGTLVTLDANGATTGITKRINKCGGDWLIGLKTNQGTLYNLCEHCFANEEVSALYRTEEQGHGRNEIRTYTQVYLDECKMLGMQKCSEIQTKKWESLHSFIRVDSQRTTHNNDGEQQTSSETRYFMSSLRGSTRDAAEAVRSHWGVENNLHWQMDVSFREDHWQARIKHSAENLAAIRRLVLNMLKQEKVFKGGIRRKMKKCGWDTNYLERVLMSQPAVH